MIHPTAIIAPGAQVGDDIEIGPYTLIGEDVVLGSGCRLGAHISVMGHTRIGDGTRIHAGAVIGDEPQDFGYKGEESYTEVGRDCILREYVTIHRGSEAGTVTRIGDNVMMMGFSHAGHNVEIGDNAVIANATLLAGHVHVGAGAFVSGGALVHQFVRIGRLAMVGGGAHLGQDMPPFCMFQYDYMRGLNTVGLRRAGFEPRTRSALKTAYRILFRDGLRRAEAVRRIREELPDLPEVRELAEFVESSGRGIMPASTRRGESANTPSD